MWVRQVAQVEEAFTEHDNVQEIGDQAVWSLSTCKPGHGIQQLRDTSTETYWQSDGPQPHALLLQFPRKMPISHVCLYADFKQDESYTPQRVSVRVGSHIDDLQEILNVTLDEPIGWQILSLGHKAQTEGAMSWVHAHCLQICILSNHQNGKDTHVRCIQVYAPRLRTEQGMRFETELLQHYSLLR